MHGYVDRHQVRSIDWKVFFKLNRLFIEDNANDQQRGQNDKTKPSDKSIFRSVSLRRFTAKLHESTNS